MKAPFAHLAAALAGVKLHEFGIGWANGLARWATRPASGVLAENTLEPGVKYAASEAAVTFMRELGQ